MRTFAKQTKLAFILAMCAVGATETLAQGSGVANATVTPDPNQVKGAAIIQQMLKRNSERTAALERYTSERTYSLDYSGTGGEHHAEVKVHAEYTRPERKHLTIVAESGSKFLCEKVLRKLVEGEQEASEGNNRNQISLGPENYTAVLIGEETPDWPGVTPGVKAWVLRVTPKIDNKFTYAGRIWISEDDFAIMRILAEPAKNPSFWLNHASMDMRYIRHGDLWLPGKNISSSHIKIGGEAKMTIDYGTYPVVAASPVRSTVETAEVQAQSAKVMNASLSER